MREVLDATDVPIEMDARATAWLEDLRHEWHDRLHHPVRSTGNRTAIDGFAGVAVHRAVLAALELDGTADGPSCEVAAPLDDVRRRATTCLAELEGVLAAEAGRQADRLPLRHRELVPPSVLLAEARRYHVDDDGIQRVLSLAAGETAWPG